MEHVQVERWLKKEERLWWAKCLSAAVCPFLLSPDQLIFHAAAKRLRTTFELCDQNTSYSPNVSCTPPSATCTVALLAGWISIGSFSAHPAVWRCYECSGLDQWTWIYGLRPALGWHHVAFSSTTATYKAHHCAPRSVPSTHACHTNQTLLHWYQSMDKRVLLIKFESVSYHWPMPACMSDSSNALWGFLC